MSVIENIQKTMNELGDVELSGVSLESCDGKLLDVGEYDLDRHVAVQPAAIAYFGSLKKEASRRLGSLKKAYERWEKKKYAEAKIAALSGTQTKATVADIEARYIVDNEKDIEKWENQIEKAQHEYDTLDSWYEAWRQKSFSIREFVQVDEDERFNNSSSMKTGDREQQVFRKSSDSSDRTSRVRDIMKKNRERKNKGKEE